MKRITISICLFSMLLTAITVHAQSSMEVGRAVVCTTVENRQPVGVSDAFPKNVGKVYLFSEIIDAGSPQGIRHVWYYDNQQVSAIELKVDGMRWRTWSNKTIMPSAVGDWHVEIQDNDGNVLVSVPFRIE